MNKEYIVIIVLSILMFATSLIVVKKPTSFISKPDKKLKLCTIREITLSTNWTIDNINGYFTQTVIVDDICLNDQLILELKMSGNLVNMKNQQIEYSKILNAVANNGSITFVADAATEKMLTILIKVIE